MRSTALPFYPAFLYIMYPGTHQRGAYLSIRMDGLVGLRLVMMMMMTMIGADAVFMMFNLLLTSYMVLVKFHILYRLIMCILRVDTLVLDLMLSL